MIITPQLYFMILTESSETLSETGESRGCKPEVEGGILPMNACFQALTESGRRVVCIMPPWHHFVSDSDPVGRGFPLSRE